MWAPVLSEGPRRRGAAERVDRRAVDVGDTQGGGRAGPAAEELAADTAAGVVDRLVDGGDRAHARAGRTAALCDCARLTDATFVGSLPGRQALGEEAAGHPEGAPGRARHPGARAPGEIAQVDFGYVGPLDDAVPAYCGVRLPVKARPN